MIHIPITTLLLTISIVINTYQTPLGRLKSRMPDKSTL